MGLFGKLAQFRSADWRFVALETWTGSKNRPKPLVENLGFYEGSCPWG